MEAEPTFGPQVRERRKSHDLTQEQLAELVGCSVELIRKIERGLRRPSRETAVRLARILGLPDAALPAFVAAARRPLSRAERAAALPTAPPLQLTPPPAPWTVLVGRAAELAELARLLADPECRLITLIGPAGVGKTRLAIEAARSATFPDGVAYAALEGVASAELLPLALAEAVGLPLAGPRDPAAQLAAHLRERRMLLVLDNIEHLAGSSALLAELLQAAAQLRLLVTSRERLGLRGEWLFALEGLPLEVSGGAALDLFTAHARRVRGGKPLPAADLPAAAQICRLVEGTPLAIELAAGWTRALSCGAIAAEIARTLDFLSAETRDLPPRQRSMRAAFESAWELLAEDERTHLRRLAVFAGGCDLPAAMAVAGVGPAALTALLDRSLIRRGRDGRYAIHALLHQFAAERLAADPAAPAVRARHSCYFAERLGAALPHLRGPDQDAALAALLADVDNLRLAWGWIVAAQDGELAAQAFKALWYLHEIRGWQREGATLFGAAVESWGAADAIRAELLAAHGWFLLRSGRHAAAKAPLEQSLALARALEAQPTVATALDYLGLLDLFAERYTAARALLEESLSIHRTIGNAWGEAFALGYLGLIAARLGDLVQARPLLDAALHLMRALGDRRGTASCLLFLGGTLAVSGAPDEAEDRLRECLALAGRVGDRWNVAAALGYLGAVAQARGALEEADYLLHEGAALMQALGDPWGEAQIRALANV